MSNYLILIPARYGSSRFPGKPLAKINDKPMIQYVLENCQKTGFDYAVVTDNDDIEEFIKSIDGNVVRVNDEVTTGSERIALAYKQFFSEKNYQYIINVQGDEPLLSSDEIIEIARFHNQHDFDICTAVKQRNTSEEDFNNPNVVKAIFSEIDHKCLYFSRASLPYQKEEKPAHWHQHVGIYSYRTDALTHFVAMKVSRLEKAEHLEQLRALENGLSIGAKLTNINLIGVDTPDDIHKIEGVLREQKE